MRFLLMAFLSVLVSCGQGGGSSSSGSKDGPQNEEYVTDIREVDLLDVAMDVPIEVTGNKIIFKQSFSDSVNGVRSSCSVAVTSGEAYSYKLDDGKLVLLTANGQRMSFKRVNEGSGLVGGWTSKSYQGQQLIMRRVTFVSENRMIMRTHCES